MTIPFLLFVSVFVLTVGYILQRLESSAERRAIEWRSAKLAALGAAASEPRLALPASTGANAASVQDAPSLRNDDSSPLLHRADSPEFPLFRTMGYRLIDGAAASKGTGPQSCFELVFHRLDRRCPSDYEGRGCGFRMYSIQEPVSAPASSGVFLRFENVADICLRCGYVSPSCTHGDPTAVGLVRALYPDLGALYVGGTRALELLASSTHRQLQHRMASCLVQYQRTDMFHHAQLAALEPLLPPRTLSWDKKGRRRVSALMRNAEFATRRMQQLTTYMHEMRERQPYVDRMLRSHEGTRSLQTYGYRGFDPDCPPTASEPPSHDDYRAIRTAIFGSSVT